MATLNLDSLTATDAPMQATKRGREAQPLPENIVSMVKDSYALPKGQGKTIKVPNGERDDKDNDTNVLALTRVLRRAAASLDYGLSVQIGEPNTKTTPVTFKAQTKVQRRTKAEKAYDEMVTFWRDTFTESEEEYADVQSVEDLADYADAEPTELLSVEQVREAITDAWDAVFTDNTEDDGQG